MKFKLSWISMLLTVACLMTVTVGCGEKGGEMLSTSEPQAEETEASSEAVTEAPTEAPTEPVTEPQTEPATEPEPEPATEPEINYTVKARDTALEGTQVNFNVGVNQRCNPIDLTNVVFITGQIINASNPESLELSSHVFQFYSRFQEFLTDVLGPESKNKDEFSGYTDEYFENNALIVLFITRNAAPLEHRINAVTKNGSEICINIGANEMNRSDGGYMGVIQNHIIIIEIDKNILKGTDTISHYVTLW